MAKPKKVIRTKTLYKKNRLPQKAVSRILFFLLILVLIGVGFIVMREWSMRFGPNADKTPISSVQPSSAPSSSAPLSSEEEVSSAPVSSKPPEPPKDVLPQDAAFISAEELLNNSADLPKLMQEYKLKNSAVIIELKPISGKLSYKSIVENAANYGALTENAPALADIVTAALDAGLTPIAQISTFKDQTAPHVSRNNSFAYGTSLGTNWLDNSLALGGKPWLNPYMEEARKYLCDIAREIDAAGIKFIVAANMMFPDKNTGEMNTINQTPTRDEILIQALKEMEDATPNAVVILDKAKQDDKASSSQVVLESEKGNN